MGNLLVVDFDYFFPNKLEAGEYEDRELFLYDWSHDESKMLTDWIWHTRAAAFETAGLPLPQVNDEWRTFASRFKLSDECMVTYADSNAYAGLCTPGDEEEYEGPWEQVWLYDAHHDCGYHVDSYDDWTVQFRLNGLAFSCEDWMLVHQMRGSELHYRWPQWQNFYNKGKLKYPPGVELDAAVDGMAPDVEFDHVFICRSGGWVPSWCDTQFFAFLDTWPVREVEEVAECTPRVLDKEAVAVEVEAVRRLREQLGNAS